MFPMALTEKKAKRVGRREHGFRISFDSWNAGDTMLPAVTAAMKAGVCLASMASRMFAGHLCGYASFLPNDSKSCRVRRIEFNNADHRRHPHLFYSPLAHGFLPIAKQRRQEIAQDHPRSGLDLYYHRHAR
jgi:hypothetical protein